MGLKEMLKQQPFETELPEQSELQSRPKDLEMIQELTEQITALTLINSEMESKNHELQSLVTTQHEQIELLTERASNLNEIETMNRKLDEVTIEATATRDKAAQQAEWAAERARREEARAQEAEKRRADAVQRQYAAEQAARKAESIKKGTQTKYKSLFTGLCIFTVILAVLMAWSKRSVFAEIGQWWADRWANLVSVGNGLKTAFLWAVNLLGNWLPVAWCYVIAGVVSLAILAGLFFLYRRLGAALGDVVRRIKEQCQDGVYKAVITAVIALGLFYVCLWFYEPIRSVWPFNIFSLWLALSFIGGIAWNFQEIKGGLIHEY